MNFRTLATSAVMMAAISIYALPAAAQEKAQTTSEAGKTMSAQDRGAIEDVVREYLLSNPEVIVEAIRIYREKQEQAQAEQAQKALSAHRSSLTEAKNAPFAGNPKASVTVVEFFDYQCGYCKRMLPMLRQLLDEDKDLRWVFKEFPILGPNSLTASRAALAAWNLDPAKYVAFHAALMGASGGLTEERVLKIAERVGYDEKKLKSGMDSDAVSAEIQTNHRLAETLNIRGTPAFIVGDELVPGAIDLETLRNLIKKARKG